MLSQGPPGCVRGAQRLDHFFPGETRTFFPGETRTRLVGVGAAWFRYWLAAGQRAMPVFFGTRKSAEIFTDVDAWSAADRNATADAVG